MTNFCLLSRNKVLEKFFCDSSHSFLERTLLKFNQLEVFGRRVVVVVDDGVVDAVSAVGVNVVRVVGVGLITVLGLINVVAVNNIIASVLAIGALLIVVGCCLVGVVDVIVVVVCGGVVGVVDD